MINESGFANYARNLWTKKTHLGQYISENQFLEVKFHLESSAMKLVRLGSSAFQKVWQRYVIWSSCLYLQVLIFVFGLCALVHALPQEAVAAVEEQPAAPKEKSVREYAITPDLEGDFELRFEANPALKRSEKGTKTPGVIR